METRTIHVIGDGWEKDAVVHLDANHQPQTLDLDATSLARLGLDRFTQDITHQTHKTPRGTIDAVLTYSNYFVGFVDLLVNKSDVVAKYPAWSGMDTAGHKFYVKSGAEKISNLIAARAASMWNWRDMQPGELLDSPDPTVPTSLAYARYSQHDTRGYYIPDALYQGGASNVSIAPGQPGYRPEGQYFTPGPAYTPAPPGADGTYNDPRIFNSPNYDPTLPDALDEHGNMLRR